MQNLIKKTILALYIGTAFSIAFVVSWFLMVASNFNGWFGTTGLSTDISGASYNLFRNLRGGIIGLFLFGEV